MDEKEQAIKKTSGATVILAGAGTGKSYTIKRKIDYLINESKTYKSSEILCLTFSNEATNNLSKGIYSEIKNSSGVVVKTFDSFCVDILKESGELIGISPDFKILLPDDAIIILHKEKNITPYYANTYVKSILTAKNFGITLEQMKEYIKNLEENYRDDISELKLFLQTYYLLDKEQKKEQKDYKKDCANKIKLHEEYEKFKNFISAWETYEELKKERNYLDFSDLSNFALKILRNFDYSHDFKYVFVDEFQDTNKLQFELIEHIAYHHNITVVGDPNQSIYGFRGSYKESFNHFKEVFNVTQEFRLDKSHRSTNKILNVSHNLIKNNYSDEKDCVYVQNVDNIIGDNVKVISCLNSLEEARSISNLVEEKISSGISLNEICILYRTHTQATIIKEALEQKKIPVISAGKINLFQKPEIKTIIAYLGIISNIYNKSATGEQSWWHLFHYKNNLPLSDSIKIGNFLKAKNRNSEHKLYIDDLLFNYIDELDLSSEGKRIFEHISSTLLKISKLTNKSLPELILDIYEITGLNRTFSYNRNIENIEGMMNLKKFHDIAITYYENYGGTISDFIEYIETIDSVGVNINASQIMYVNAVRMMTIHASKGLEFDTVILSNMAEDRFPITRTKNEPLIPKELIYSDVVDIKKYEAEIQLLEERRLCYVAMTRAKNNLYLTFAKEYKKESNPSVFLEEVDYLKNENIEFIEDDLKNEFFNKQNKTNELKNQLIYALENEDIINLKTRLEKFVNKRDLVLNEDKVKFDSSSVIFSPSSIMTYLECPKKYELAHLFKMPAKNDFLDTNATTIGSFLHKVFEDGVKANFQKVNDFIELAKKDKLYDDDVKRLIEVFFKRNYGQYDKNSLVELKVDLDLLGYKFFGIVDRLDVVGDGVRIVDYKTNKNAIEPKKREVQLGFYALALKEKGYDVREIVLDMLKLDSPVIMKVEGDNVSSLVGARQKFKLSEFREFLISIADNIKNDYENEFLVVEDDNACRFCGYKFYCSKWEN